MALGNCTIFIISSPPPSPRQNVFPLCPTIPLCHFKWFLFHNSGQKGLFLIYFLELFGVLNKLESGKDKEFMTHYFPRMISLFPFL